MLAPLGWRNGRGRKQLSAAQNSVGTEHSREQEPLVQGTESLKGGCGKTK